MAKQNEEAKETVIWLILIRNREKLATDYSIKNWQKQ